LLVEALPVWVLVMQGLNIHWSQFLINMVEKWCFMVFCLYAACTFQKPMQIIQHGNFL